MVCDTLKTRSRMEFFEEIFIVEIFSNFSIYNRFFAWFHMFETDWSRVDWHDQKLSAKNIFKNATLGLIPLAEMTHPTIKFHTHHFKLLTVTLSAACRAHIYSLYWLEVRPFSLTETWSIQKRRVVDISHRFTIFSSIKLVLHSGNTYREK